MRYLQYVGGGIDHTSSDDGEHLVGGYFTDDKVDMYGHMIDRLAMVEAIAEWKKWGNIRDMHGDLVGVAREVGGRAWNYLLAEIIPDDVWELVKKGAYNGFSVGILVTDGEFVDVNSVPEEKFEGLSAPMVNALRSYGEIFVIKALEIVEVSIVDRPANPRALLDYVRNGMLDGIELLPHVKDIRKMLDNGGVIVENKVDETVNVEAVEEESHVVADVAEEQVLEEKSVVEPEVEMSAEEGDVATEENEVQVPDSIVELNANIEKLSAAFSELSDKITALIEHQIAEAVENAVKSSMVTRKGVVNRGDEKGDVVEEKNGIDYRKLSRSELATRIALAAVARRS